MKSKQLTRSILSSFVFVTVLAKCNKIMLFPGNLIRKTGFFLFLFFQKENIILAGEGIRQSVGFLVFYSELDFLLIFACVCLYGYHLLNRRIIVVVGVARLHLMNCHGIFTATTNRDARISSVCAWGNLTRQLNL